MFIVLQGIESATHRDTLTSICDDFEVTADIKAGISYKTLKSRRLGPNYIADTAKKWPIVIEAGVSQKTELSPADALVTAKSYYDFALDQEGIEWIVEFEHPALDDAGAEAVRTYRALDDRILPLWSITQSGMLTDLQDIFNDFDRVALSGSMLKDRRVPPILRASKSITGTTLVLGTSQFETAVRAGATGVSTQAWLAAARFREWIWWNGRELNRASSAEREFMLKKHRAEVQARGFDADLLERNDSREYSRVAGYSFLCWAASLESLSAHSENEDEDDPGSDLVPADHSTGLGSKVTRTPRMIPGFGTNLSRGLEETDSGRAVIGEREVLTTSGTTVRMCDSCFLSMNCPAFTPGANCAFHMPIEVRTPAQVKALLNSMLELQATRVAFARFAEEATGGDLDQNVGAEMDRLFRMAGGLKKIEERHERLTVSVEHEQSGRGPGLGGDSNGVLSALFGPKASSKRENQQLEADAIIAEVIER